MLNLVKDSSPILSQKCPVFDFDTNFDEYESYTQYLKELTHNMFKIMYQSEGIGLSAPQIGLLERLFVMDVDSEQIVCVNPKIIEFSDKDVLYLEGCLSFPGLKLNIKRPESIYVCYQLIDGSEIRRNLDGIASRCFQHELDHLNGITFDSKISKLSLKIAKERQTKLLKKLRRRGL